MATNFDQITASTATLATFLASLPTMRGPWDAAFDAVVIHAAKVHFSLAIFIMCRFQFLI